MNAPQPTAKRRLTPRQQRAIDLLRAGAWIDRHLIDSIAGCAHGPGLIYQLRALLGDDAIQTRKIERIDRDGRPCLPGQYRLAPQAMPRLAQLEAGK